MVPNDTPTSSAFLDGITWARLEHILDEDSPAGDNARHQLASFVLGWAWHDDDLRNALIQDLAPELVDIPGDTGTPHPGNG